MTNEKVFKEKILVVDDDKRVRDSFIHSFDDEYRIVLAADGQEALNILSHPHDIDLIVVDMMMPGLTGIELIKEIKKINPKHKVILLTGYSSKDIVVEALRSDADEYVEKPFDVRKIREIFERFLGEQRDFDKSGIDNREGKVIWAQRFIRRNCNKPLTLRDVSKELFLSPKYLSRVFKKKTGKGFARYKIELKIEIAKDMLEKTNFNITQIAYRAGYRNPASFMKIFKRVTNLTPSQYRFSKRTNISV
ncbi:response regulator [Candidatus Omnitrophota bacterium]